MPTWDPGQYLKFSDHRLRPALDLMAQIPLESPRTIYDLGCGPGNITRLLAERWPNAAVTGIDSSPDMLVKARNEAPAVTFDQADIGSWSPPAPADLLYTNATLHWLDDHAVLLPRFASHLAPGGVLAIQMPSNSHSPSHILMDEAAASGPWRARLSEIRPIYRSIETPDAYYRILSPLLRRIDIWQTDYLHVLEGDNPVVEWTRGTALRPYLDALDEPERGAFLAAYSARIAAAYPNQPDGRTLLPFRRIFLLARA
ncbi:MAG TPA: trans-aconitate 2-methyltransferase [Dongiaceae bacterium]|jgi:trans-aconitate 2-methyltransferase|nr:trans-aconitate 2-methyltransferase [Dongiaceae bacterium]